MLKRADLGVMLAVVAAPGLLPGPSIAETSRPAALRLPARSISIAGSKFLASPAGRLGDAVVDVRLTGGAHMRRVTASDFSLSAGGDMFGVEAWNAKRFRVTLQPGHSRVFRLTFRAPRAAVDRGALSYHPTAAATPVVVRLNGPSTEPTVTSFPARAGVGDPWGIAVDTSGNLWFAEPGCDFGPTCPSSTPPGQIGELDPLTGAVAFFTLPDAPGNQPIFLAFDGSGNLWFTTPNNSMIGEFDPSTRTFLGQWPVTAGSGPWDLTFSGGQIWYTEHLVSAVGTFNPSTHEHQDFPTPSPNSNPYGITASGGLIWFTENNSTVDRIASLATGNANAIAEYPIDQSPTGGTPHLTVTDTQGRPWWTEGWTGSIATLDPTIATPGICGQPSGTCDGIHRFQGPPSGACGSSTHTSGIAFQDSAKVVWLDNSLTSQVGSFSPANDEFTMVTLGDCLAHPHDGLNLDAAGDVWFDEEFANAIGELIPAGVPGTPAMSGTTAVALPQPPVNTAQPAILGSAKEGRIVRVTNGSWTNHPSGFSYGWQRCNPGCKAIAGAMGDAYRLAKPDVDAHVRAIVSATNAGGSAHAQSTKLGPVGPARKAVQAAVRKALVASLRHWPTRRLLAHGAYRLHFDPPSAGRLAISWLAPRRHVQLARRHSRRNAGRALIVTGGQRFAKAGAAAKVTVRLTRAGSRLLRQATRLRVTAKVAFTPAGEPAVVARKPFSLDTRGSGRR